jgi:hypothetical protein
MVPGHQTDFAPWNRLLPAGCAGCRIGASKAQLSGAASTAAPAVGHLCPDD